MEFNAVGGHLAVECAADHEGGGSHRFGKALCIGMLPGETFAQQFAAAKAAGFAGVECNPLSNESDRRAMGEAADAAGIVVHSVMHGGWGAPLSSPDEAVAAQGLKDMEKSILTAKAVGADAVLLVPAVVKEDQTEAEAWAISQRNVRKVIPLAKEKGVVIAVENVWNNFTYKLDDFVRYIDEFDSPFVQAYFDVGNHVIRSDWATPQEWIRTLGKRIRKVHLKDYHIERNEWSMLLEGSVDWPEVAMALAEVGYDGWLTCELGSGDESYLRDVSARVDRIIAYA